MEKWQNFLKNSFNLLNVNNLKIEFLQISDFSKHELEERFAFNRFLSISLIKNIKRKAKYR